MLRDRRDLSEGKLGAVRPGQNDKAGEAGRAAPLIGETEADLTVGGLKRTEGAVEALCADCSCKLRDGEAVLFQHRPRHCYPELTRSEAGHRDLRHPGEDRQFVLKTSSVTFQMRGRQIARHGNRGNVVGAVKLAHDCWVGLVGKIVDRRHLGAQIIHKSGTVA